MARKKPAYKPHGHKAPSQERAREDLYRLFAERPMSDPELLVNFGLYTRASALAKMLFLDEIYRPVTKLPGVMMVFGTWWGQDVAVLHNLRAIHEPYNSLRKVIGFDTFDGYPSLSATDRASETIKVGAYHTSANYSQYLDELLEYHNSENVLGHTRKHELVKGDVMETLPRWLDEHPETLVALAYLDLALYEPTKRVLELLKPRMVKGGVVAMDELNTPEYAGETVALREVFDLREHTLLRSQFLPDRSFLVF